MDSEIKLMNRNSLHKILKFLVRTKQILELKNSMNEVKNTLDSLGNGAYWMEERISYMEDRNFEVIQKKRRTKTLKK